MISNHSELAASLRNAVLLAARLLLAFVSFTKVFF